MFIISQHKLMSHDPSLTGLTLTLSTPAVCLHAHWSAERDSPPVTPVRPAESMRVC